MRRDGFDDFPEIRHNNEFERQYGNANTGGNIWGGANKNSNNLEIPTGLEDSNVIICEPRDNSDIQYIIDNLKKGEAVIVDLQKVEDNSSQRILDILSGGVYALAGSIKRLKGRMFIATPAGVSIKGNNNGLVKKR